MCWLIHALEGLEKLAILAKWNALPKWSRLNSDDVESWFKLEESMQILIARREISTHLLLYRHMQMEQNHVLNSGYKEKVGSHLIWRDQDGAWLCCAAIREDDRE